MRRARGAPSIATRPARAAPAIVTWPRWTRRGGAVGVHEEVFVAFPATWCRPRDTADDGSTSAARLVLEDHTYNKSAVVEAVNRRTSCTARARRPKLVVGRRSCRWNRSNGVQRGRSRVTRGSLSEN